MKRPISMISVVSLAILLAQFPSIGTARGESGGVRGGGQVVGTSDPQLRDVLSNNPLSWKDARAFMVALPYFKTFAGNFSQSFPVLAYELQVRAEKLRVTFIDDDLANLPESPVANDDSKIISMSEGEILINKAGFASLGSDRDRFYAVLAYILPSVLSGDATTWAKQGLMNPFSTTNIFLKLMPRITTMQSTRQPTPALVCTRFVMFGVLYF